MYLIRDPLLRSELGARALLRAKRYSVAKMVEGYLQAYRSAALRSRVVTSTTYPELLPGKPVVQH
jgi:hypothetical protein